MKKLVVTFNDDDLVHRINMLPKHSKGKFIERAIALYLESEEGAAVFEILKKERAVGRRKKTQRNLGNDHSAQVDLVKKVLGDV